MKDDPEITAMATLKGALEPLDEEVRLHVIRWVNERFGGGKGRGIQGQANVDRGDEFEEIETLFNAANPRTGAEKALVGGYWLQEIRREDGFESAKVNSELKNLGHGVGNITRAFDDLKKQKMAMQVHKSGKTKQGRKKYKITGDGIKKVKNMISGEPEKS